jgi:hypothetical protein
MHADLINLSSLSFHIASKLLRRLNLGIGFEDQRQFSTAALDAINTTYYTAEILAHQFLVPGVTV